MKIYLLTLGCAKNRVDSECLAGALKAAGHELVPAVEDAQAASDTIEELMGDRADLRRDFIIRNALSMEDLDI